MSRGEGAEEVREGSKGEQVIWEGGRGRAVFI